MCLTDFDSKHRLMAHAEEHHEDYLNHMGLGVDCETCPENVKKKSRKPKVEAPNEEVDEEAKNLFGLNKAANELRWVDLICSKYIFILILYSICLFVYGDVLCCRL